MRRGSIFVDTNAVVWYLKGKPDVVNLLDGYERLCSNIVVFLETLHVYRRALLRTGMRLNLEPIVKFFQAVTLLPVEPISLEEIVKVIVDYNLLPNDALIAITCRYYGIDTIVSLDEDFRRVPWLTVVP